MKQTVLIQDCIGRKWPCGNQSVRKGYTLSMEHNLLKLAMSERFKSTSCSSCGLNIRVPHAVLFKCLMYFTSQISCNKGAEALSRRCLCNIIENQDSICIFITINEMSSYFKLYVNQKYFVQINMK